MKVRELQEQLSKLNPDLDVLCYTEDSSLLAAGHGFRLLGIEDVSTAEGQRVRTDDGTPSLKFGKERGSATFAVLNVTADF